MILDALETFDPAGTAITVTAVSTNVLDMGIINAQQPGGNQQRDVGPSYSGWDSLDVLVQIGTTFTAAGAATLQVSIQAAVDAGGGGAAQTPGTFYDQMMTGILPVANLTTGREIIRCPIPRWSAVASNVATRPRFYRLNYTVATGPMTAGNVLSTIVGSSGRQDNYQYISGIPATA